MAEHLLSKLQELAEQVCHCRINCKLHAGMAAAGCDAQLMFGWAIAG